MVFDPTEPDIDDSQLVREDWPDIAFGECKEDYPQILQNQRELA